MRKLNIHQLFDLTRTGLKPQEMILDVREPDEFVEGHIPHATNFPLATLQERLNELRKYETIYIHCRAGGRAQKAADFLKNSGLQNLCCISESGFVEWESSGYPVERGTGIPS